MREKERDRERRGKEVVRGRKRPTGLLFFVPIRASAFHSLKGNLHLPTKEITKRPQANFLYNNCQMKIDASHERPN